MKDTYCSPATADMIVVRPAASSALMLAPSRRALRTASTLPLRAARCRSKLSEYCSLAIIEKGEGEKHCNVRDGVDEQWIAEYFCENFGGDRVAQKTLEKDGISVYIKKGLNAESEGKRQE